VSATEQRFTLDRQNSDTPASGCQNPLLTRPAVGNNAAMEAEPPKSKRRWFQFSLRTLMIVVTVLAVPLGYFGWQAKIVRERRELLNWITQTGGKAYPLVSEQVGRYGEVPLLRRLLGDRTIGAIKLPHSVAPEERQSIQRAIPEAEIWPTYVQDEHLIKPMSGTATIDRSD
jgi:hypothetical protein